MEIALACAPAVAQAPDTAPVPTETVQSASSFAELIAAQDPGTIQVTGQAFRTVPADRVRISFAVETEAATAGAATSENASQMERVVRAVRALDLEGLDLETYGYSLRPEYETARDGTGARSISGYRAQNMLRVTVDDVDATGRVLDAAVEAGANRVANLSFEASDTHETRLDALKSAVHNAREQAEAIAEAMGVELGRVIEIQGGSNAPSPQSMGGLMFRAAAEASTPVEAGDQMVSASVTVTFSVVEGGL
jgi:uncharacterized protein YggE